MLNDRFEQHPLLRTCYILTLNVSAGENQKVTAVYNT